MAIAFSRLQYELPAPLSTKWTKKGETAGWGSAFRSKCGLLVMCSIEDRDGNDWLHVSFSRARKTPTYDDISLVKRLFIGEGRNAYMVFPKKTKHVNIHAHCLHLWCNISNPQPLPEFSNTLLGVRCI